MNDSHKTPEMGDTSIAEQKQVEEALRAERDFNAALVEASPAFLVTINGDGRIRSMNQAMLQALGYTLEEVAGKDYLTTVVSEAERPLLAGVFARLTELREPTLNENYMLAKDGRLILVEWHGRPILKPDGEFDYFFGFGLDITERTRAEGESKHLASILESTTDLVAIADMEARVIYMNRAGRKMVGIGDDEDITATHIPDFTPQWALETVLNKGVPTAIQEGSWSGEGAMLARDGHEIPVSQVIMVHRAADGTPQNLSTVARDITEQNQAREALREARDRAQLYLDVAGTVIVALDTQGSVVLLNKQGLNLLGYTQEKAIGANWFDLIIPEDIRDAVKGVFAQIMSGHLEQTEYYENEIVAKGGVKRIMAWHNSLLKNKNGDISGVLSSGEDITERKQAEERIMKNEARLKEAEEVGKVGSWDYDMTTDTLTWSDHTYRVYGRDPETFEVSFPSVVAHYPPGDKEAVLEAFQKSIQNRTELTIEHRIITGNNETRFVFERGRVTYSEDGTPLRMIGSVADITERKRLEDELRTTSLYTRNLIEASLDPLVTISPEGKITDVNHATEQVTGVSREGLIGNDFADYFTEPDKAREGYQQVFSQGIVKDYPLTIRHASGRVTDVLYNASVYQNEAGQVQGVFAAARDITESKRLEAQVQEVLERRGYQVQVSTEISQEVASASEINDLFGRVVTLTKERLGYYHTQLFRYDAAQDAVVLINGYGETGQKMLAEGHKLPMGSGLIGTAAASGQTVMRPTLAEDPDWQPNPLLPDTQGEIAVPIKFQDKVLGVLDAQSNRAGVLTEDDRLLLEGLCGQVAVAIEQTRLRQEMAERLEEVNRLYRSMSHEGWKTYRDTAGLPTGFMFDQTGIRPVDEAGLADELFANIPMQVLGGEVVGTLTVANDPRHPTSPEDYTFLQQVSDQIALALESARLSAQTQSALEQTEKLAEAGLRFSRAADLQGLLTVVSEMLGISSTNRALLGVFNYSSTGELEGMDIVANWWSGSGHEPSEIGRHYSMETLNIMPLFISDATVFYNDTFYDERVTGATLELFTRQNIRSMAVLPLYLGLRQIGVLFLEAEEPHIFTPEETQLFSAIGPQVATVLENRRQFERAQKQAERESTLNVISQKIQSATTVEAVLQIAARELGHALGAPMTIAQLSMKDKK